MWQVCEAHKVESLQDVTNLGEAHVVQEDRNMHLPCHPNTMTVSSIKISSIRWKARRVVLLKLTQAMTSGKEESRTRTELL